MKSIYCHFESCTHGDLLIRKSLLRQSGFLRVLEMTSGFSVMLMLSVKMQFGAQSVSDTKYAEKNRLRFWVGHLV